jgi:6-phosphogluconolactonase
VYFSDERCVPVTDARNNFAKVQDLLISRVPIVAERVHPIPTVGEPRELAERYDALLRQRFDATDTPAFDVAILGIGTDGHTASLFPGSSALRERERWALAVTAPPGVDVPDRITLTLPALNRSRRVLFVVAGRNKGDAVRQLSATPASTAWPASLVRGLERTDWLLDATAAS